MSDLRSQTKVILSGPHPLGEPEASMLRLVARYVAGEPWDDPELRDLLSRCLATAQSQTAEPHPCTGPAGDLWIFYHRVAAVLQGIQIEVW